MDYNNQIEQDFYEVYTVYLSQAGFNVVTTSLIIDQLKLWFGIGHRRGVQLMAQSTQQYINMIKKYGGHIATCPSNGPTPAECNCGWQDIAKEFEL